MSKHKMLGFGILAKSVIHDLYYFLKFQCNSTEFNHYRCHCTTNCITVTFTEVTAAD